MAFCRWYDKQFENVSEHEQEQCKENGQDCRTCPDLIADSKQAAAVAADVLDEMADFAENRKEMTKEEKESKEEELLGRFAAKMIKIQRFS